MNPAFEASRFEAIYSSAKPTAGCPYPVDRPKLIVVTADNDWATGAVFTFFRSAITVFEKYDATTEKTSETEKISNVHAIGFVDRYKTHRLELTGQGAARCIRQYLDPAADVNTLDPNIPVWVVGVTPDIVNGHDGFLYPDIRNGKYEPFLLNWLVNIYLDKNHESDENHQSIMFNRLFDQYRQYRCVDKAVATVQKNKMAGDSR